MYIKETFIIFTVICRALAVSVVGDGSVYSLMSAGLAVRLLGVSASWADTDTTSLPAEHRPSFDKERWKPNQSREQQYKMMLVSHPLCLLIFTNCWYDRCSASFCRMKSVSSFHCGFISKSLSSCSGLASSSSSSESFWGWNNKTHLSSLPQSNQAIDAARV